MLAEDIRRGPIGKSLAITHPTRDLRYDPPIRFCFTWGLQEGTLPRDTPLRICDGAILLPPGGCRQQNLCTRVDRVVRNHIVGNDKEIKLRQRVANRARPRHGYRRIGPHDPERLDLAALYRVEHLNRFQPFPPCNVRGVPKSGDTIDLCW